MSSRDSCLGLLDDDLLRLTLLTLELESLATLQLYLTWLHQLNLHKQNYISVGPAFREVRFCDPFRSVQIYKYINSSWKYDPIYFLKSPFKSPTCTEMNVPATFERQESIYQSNEETETKIKS